MGVRRLLTAALVDLKGKLIAWMHLKNMHSSPSFKVKSDLIMMEWYASCILSFHYCGRQEEPAILISRLLLRMRRMYVASIRLDLHSISYPESSDFLTKKPEDSGYEIDFQ